MSNLISCPSCRTEIEITEALEAQLTAQIRREMGAELKAKQAELSLAHSKLADQRQSLADEQAAFAAKVKAGIDAERAAILAEAKKSAAESLALEMKDQATQLSELQTKLRDARENELEIRKRERELLEKTEELKLAAAREVNAQRGMIREAAMKQFLEEHQLKDAETQKLVSDLRSQIGSLKQKAEQGSMQMQGEVQELALEEMLESTFLPDSIEPVGKGVNGADCKQVVFCPNGTKCGSILWESKRTKNFQKSWLAKLRDDQRSARASVAVIVTQVMPEGIDTFGMVDGVWVCSWRCAKGLAMALRAGLIEVGKTQIATQGRAEKMELVYNYLSSQEFQHSVSGIVEAFIAMQSDLDSEMRSMKRIWKKREKQIERAIDNTTALYGDLQGIVGGSLPKVEGLSLPLLESDAAVSQDATAAA